MKRFVLVITLVCTLSVLLNAQTTVFSENFSTSAGVTYTGTSGIIGTSPNWSFITLGTPDFGAKIDGGILDLTNDASVVGNVNGYGFGYTSTSSFASPYNTTLSSNIGTVSWTFNMRQIRTDPAGFGSGSYGVAFVLGSTSASVNTAGNGYAVVLGQSLATDPIRLAKYTNGLQGTLTNIIISNTSGLIDFGNDYLSVSVTYAQATNTWELFLRNDGGTGFADPAIGSLISQGTAVDATYTGAALGFLGGYWQGSTGANQTAYFDNVTVTVTPPNTISTNTVSTPPFTLANCGATANGSVDFTSTDVFPVGNIFTVQLSNDAGSFASPTTIATLSGAGAEGNGPSGTIPITIPAGTVSGSNYRIRIRSSNPVVTGSSSSAFQIIQQGACASAFSDSYHTVQIGDWSDVTTWESQSPDNPTWIPATLVPTFNANTIQIRNGHTVSITTTESADQLVIESGGILNQVSGSFTINDGIGDDVDIQNGGVFILSSGSNPPLFGAGSPVVNVATDAILRVSASGLTSAAPANGVNAANYVYQHLSVLEYTLSGGFSSNNVTYFPNVNSTTIPIFRATNPTISNLIVGAGNSTVFNGLFEYTSTTADLIWQNAGDKIFRNGIRGAGNFTANVSAAAAKFIINGTTAELGGTGSLVVPTIGGLEIGSASNNTTVSVTSNKTVTGDISLVSTNTTYVDLGTNNLTVTGNVTNGTTTSYIRTASTGALILNSVATKDFPVGDTKYNPITIHTGSGHNWTVNVNDGVTPDVPRGTTGAVLLTWNITPSLNPPTTPTDITFYFDSTLVGGQIGSEFNTPPHNSPNNVQVWHRKQGWWLASGTTIPVDPGPFGYVTARALNAQDFSPYGISRISLPLPIKLVNFSAIKISSGLAIINWELAACCSKDALFELEKSTDSRNFVLISSIDGSETNKFYFYNDSRLGKGISYYRLKMTDTDGSVKYSKVIAIVNEEKGFVITSIAPNPVQHTASITISAAKQSSVDFKVYDVAGNLVKQWQSTIAAGNNVLQMDVAALTNGTYHVLASSSGDKTVFRFIKQ